MTDLEALQDLLDDTTRILRAAEDYLKKIMKKQFPDQQNVYKLRARIERRKEHIRALKVAIHTEANLSQQNV